MDPYHLLWGLKLLTWHKCHCSPPVHIPDSNHAHCLTCNSHGSWPMVAPTEQENSLSARNGGPTYMAKSPFSKPVRAQEERNGPPRADPGLSIAMPRSSHVTWAQGWNPPTFPCPSFLLVQNPSPKDIAGSDITSWNLYDTNMHLLRIIGY